MGPGGQSIGYDLFLSAGVPINTFAVVLAKLKFGEIILAIHERQKIGRVLQQHRKGEFEMNA
jgi:hypothetical protein